MVVVIVNDCKVGVDDDFEVNLRSWEQFLVTVDQNISSLDNFINIYAQGWDYNQFRAGIAGVKKVVIIMVKDKQRRVVLGASVVIYELWGARVWFYLPAAPVVGVGVNITHYQEFVEALAVLAQQYQAVFIRAEPQMVGGDQFLGVLGWQRARDCYLPRDSVVLDLGLTEVELLTQMRQRGRRNLRKGQGAGLRVEICEDYDEVLVDDFVQILRETAQRDGFAMHPADYYHDLLREVQQTALILVWAGDMVVSAAVVIWQGGVYTYLYGASRVGREFVGAPYLLQWEAIVWARGRGGRYYDFLGVAPEGAVGHRLAGVSQFKRGFGRGQISFAVAWEFCYDDWAWRWYRGLRWLRGIYNFIKK